MSKDEQHYFFRIMLNLFLPVFMGDIQYQCRFIWKLKRGAYAEELERLYHNLEHTFVCKFYLATGGSAEAGLITNEGLCNCWSII